MGGYTELSDPSMLSTEFTSTAQREIAYLFGEVFATQLLTQEIGKWSGPIESSYGLHLVFIEEKLDGVIPPFEDVRNNVVREWTFEKIKEAKRALYESLLRRYTVTVEKADNDSGDLAKLGNGAAK